MRRMNGQKILIHYHIYKNAGSSVDAALRSSFGDAWQYFDGTHRNDIKTAGDIRQFLADHPHIRAVSSHLGRPPLPRPDCLPILFLRHPLLRARSVYRFVLQDRTQPSHGIVSALKDFADYVRWAIDSDDGGIVVRDYQVVHLSAASFRGGNILLAKATEADLAEAFALLASWGIVGIVEQFDRSAALFQRLYGPQVPGLDFHPAWTNRTSVGPLGAVEDEVRSIREEIGAGLMAALEDRNALDLRLYEFGRRLLDSHGA